jgi:hypothetical protein
MITHICDRCGRPIEKGEVRYIAKVQVFAAGDTLEISLDDLLEDPTARMERLLEQCASMTEEELMRDVFVEMQFDLCRRCQRAYLANPMAVSG